MPNYELCRHDIKKIKISTILDFVYSNFLTFPRTKGYYVRVMPSLSRVTLLSL